MKKVEDIQNMTISDMMVLVKKRVKGSALNDNFYIKNKELLDTLSSKMKVSVFQAILLSVIIELDDSLTYEDIAEHIGCKVLEIKVHKDEINELVEHRIIEKAVNNRYSKYLTITEEAAFAYYNNEPYEHVIPNNLTKEQLIRKLSTIIGVYHAQFSDEDYKPLWKYIKNLLEHNQHIFFAKALLEAENISPLGRSIILFMATELFVCRRSLIAQGIIENTFAFDSHNEVDGQFELLDLEDKGYIEAECMDGLRDDERYCLTNETCQLLFPDLDLEKLKEDYFNTGVIDTDKWPKKNLFYNTEDAEQIAQLYELLKQENFKQICQRLETEGLRSGFACLFYGVAGCGKTETVYQIAKATGRSIVAINVSDIMSKWVGDSEKHIKRFFSKYRQKVHHLEKAPILLFNEADSIIHRRHTQIDHAVDQMSNSIQNIILQEMESLEGIMIATTNFTENIDKAFDRRFIYKIEFHMPDRTTQSKIWSSMMPTLTSEEANFLAEEFDLTGGEIENVVRKTKVTNILTGVECNFETIKSICRNETIRMRDSGKKIVGFG